MSTRSTPLSFGAFLACLHMTVALALTGSAELARKFDMPIQAEIALTLVQANARVQARPPMEPWSQPPRMYVSEGCDGSTATLQHAVRILSLHGINAEDPQKNREMLIPEGNAYFASGVGIYDSLKMMTMDLAKNGQALVFKSILHFSKEITLSPHMLEMGTLAVYVTRKNPLDQLVCMIRDCFLRNEFNYGKPVTGDGSPTNLCFDRRDPNEKSDKALISVTQVYPSHTRSLLGESLDRMQDTVSSGYQDLQKAGYPGPKLAYEDIMAFEKGGEANIETSLEQWRKLLVAWDVAPNLEAVRTYLESQTGTWSQDRQVDEIYNYNEVKAELVRLGRADLLRDE